MKEKLYSILLLNELGMQRNIDWAIGWAEVKVSCCSIKSVSCCSVSSRSLQFLSALSTVSNRMFGFVVLVLLCLRYVEGDNYYFIFFKHMELLTGDQCLTRVFVYIRRYRILFPVS